MSQNRLYFGYGSNLDWDDWSRFCKKRGVSPDGLKEKEPAWLLGHHLKFHYYSNGRKGGAADVVPADAFHATPGALFDVDADAWKTLIAKEGAPQFYEEKKVLVVGRDGVLHRATTFVVCEHRKKPHFVEPTAGYQRLIYDGLIQRGLPILGLQQALQESFDLCIINHLFVYGTLMKGQNRFGLLHPFTKSIQPASTNGELHHLGAFPGMKLGEGTVFGDLVTLNNASECLETIDQIEGFLGFGHPESLYDRTIVEVMTDFGPEWAWTYIYNGKVGPDSIINDGRWID